MKNCVPALAAPLGSTLPVPDLTKSRRALSRLLRAVATSVCFLAGAASAQTSATFAWDPNPETNVTGYRLLYGTATGQHPNFVDVGPSTTGTVTGLAAGTTYYFAVTAYNSDNLTSDPSAEISYTTPGTPNATPVALGQTLAAVEDTSLPLVLTGTDANGDSLAFSIVTGPANGTLTGSPPNLTYVPKANYAGSDSFTFRANDGTVFSATATVSLAVAAVNDPPVANGQAVSLAEDATLTIVLAGSDPDGNALTYAIVTGPTKGTLTGTSPNLTYTPAANVNGSDQFTYRAHDGSTNSSTVTVQITINSVNDAPVAANSSAQTAEDTPKAITVTGTDVEGNSLTYSLVTGPANGTLSGTLPNVTFNPKANFNGTDKFTFRVNDGSSNSNTATVNLTVTAVNDAPVANAQSKETQKNKPLAISLSGSDVDGTPLTAAIVTPPAHGTLTGTLPNLTYQPANNYLGTDSFTFRVSDGQLNSAPVTVQLKVTASKNAPVAVGASLATMEETPVSFALAGTDADGDPLSYSIISGPANGSLSGTSGNLTYDPSPNFTGTDQITFKVSDGTLESTTASVVITVENLNDPPVAVPVAVSTGKNKAVAINLAAVDPDGNALKYTLVTQPKKGKLVGKGPNLRYIPDKKFGGTDVFKFRVNDGTVASKPAAVTIYVGPAGKAAKMAALKASASAPLETSNPAGLPELSIAPASSSGSVGLTMTMQADPFKNYMLERSTDAANWQDMYSITTGENGSFVFQVQVTADAPKGFFRLRELP